MKKSILFCGVLILVACQSKPVDSGPKSVSISKNICESVGAETIFDELRFVSLETNDSCLMRSPRKIIREKDTFFISDGSTIFQYTLDGRYIRSLNRKGRGPQEYFDIQDFTVRGENLFIIDRNRKMLKFTTENRYLASVKLDFYPATLFLLNDREVLLTSAYQTEADKFHVVDAESLQELSSFQPIDKAEMTYRHFMNQTNFFEFDNRLLFHEPMNNQVYEISGNTASEVYRFDFYGMNPPAEFWSHTYANVMEINRKATSEKYCFGLPVYAESREHLLFTYRDAENYRMGICSKKNGKGVQFDAIRFFEGMPPVAIEDLSCNLFSAEDMTIAIPGHLFFDDEGRICVPELASVLKGDGNPVLCLVKLK